ncbi:MAG: hypothetical protein JEZ07_01415 [Phycisphaerae bacterium]|nr:hypothetical protein [Phycisphaerae bacterium]
MDNEIADDWKLYFLRVVPYVVFPVIFFVFPCFTRFFLDFDVELHAATKAVLNFSKSIFMIPAFVFACIFDAIVYYMISRKKSSMVLIYICSIAASHIIFLALCFIAIAMPFITIFKDLGL